MLINKIVMIQCQSKTSSANYKIAKKTLTHMGNLSSYNLKTFLHDIDVQKSSFYAFLNELSLKKYKDYVKIIKKDFEDCQAKIQKIKEHEDKKIYMQEKKTLLQIFDTNKKIYIIGNQFEQTTLLLYLPLFYTLGYDVEMPFYFCDETTFLKHHFSMDHYYIFISLSRTKIAYCQSMMYIYSNSKYIDFFKNEHIYFLGKDGHINNDNIGSIEEDKIKDIFNYTIKHIKNNSSNKDFDSL